MALPFSDFLGGKFWRSVMEVLGAKGVAGFGQGFPKGNAGKWVDVGRRDGRSERRRGGAITQIRSARGDGGSLF